MATASILPATTQDIPAVFSLLPELIPRYSVAEMLDVLRMSSARLDMTPDSVDGMTSHEIYTDDYSINIENEKHAFSSSEISKRNALRAKLNSITGPLLEQRITPIVRQRFPDICAATGDRACTPCSSLIRHYKKGDRTTHTSHHDGHALVTVVVSLSDYGVDYNGGIYVGVSHGQREFLRLRRGDAVLHKSDLLHGVHVHDLKGGRSKQTERWSWIIWYRDSTSCEDNGHEWFSKCALESFPVCQMLHATKIVSLLQKQGVSNDQISSEVLRLNRAAADQGSGVACVRMARAYLKTLPSNLKFDLFEAAKYFQKGIQSTSEPDAHYGMVQIILARIHFPEHFHWHARLLDQKGEGLDKESTLGDARVSEYELLTEAVGHLEAAAKLGHPFAMFNLGIAHLYGYGTPLSKKVDLTQQEDGVEDDEDDEDEEEAEEQEEQTSSTKEIDIGSFFSGTGTGIHMATGKAPSSSGSNKAGRNNWGKKTKRRRRCRRYAKPTPDNLPKRDPELAGFWFEASRLPEGYFARAMHLRSIGKIRKAEMFENQAKSMGFGTPWRQNAREMTGSGGSAGVDLNLHWPSTHDGQKPPKW